MADNPANYEVGYRKPPKHSRFPEGRSGNPKGRPKGARDLKTDLAAELGKRIVVSEGGRKTRVSKQQALIMRLVEQALNGNMGALNTLLNLATRAFGLNDGETQTTELSADDKEILVAFREQIIRAETDQAPETTDQGSSSPADGTIVTGDAVNGTQDSVNS